MDRVKIGIVGCGGIAHGLYLPGVAKIPRADIVALCDVDPERLQATQQRFDIAQAYSHLDDMLADADIDLLINTTPIQTHYELSLKGLQAGVNVYTEKTIATTIEEADYLIETAGRQGVMLACAPDTIVWPFAVRLRELVASEVVGKVTWARMRSSHGGPEAFGGERAPSWFYQPGAGPLPDMGVYGLDLVTRLLGPAKRVTALSSITRPLRYVRRGPLKGLEVLVEVDDNVLILLEFNNGVLAFVDAGYCILNTKAPDLEVFGVDGTIALTGYMSGGPETIEVYRDDTRLGLRGWIALDERLPKPTTPAMGVSHAVDCLLNGRELSLTPEHARHVLEIMVKGMEAARTGKAQALETTF